MAKRTMNSGGPVRSGGIALLGNEPSSKAAATFAPTQATDRGVAQPGRAPDSGSGGWWFDSTHPDQQRFWSKVRVGEDDECWPWTGAVSSYGHGRFKINGKLKLPHRLAYQLLIGPIPKSLYYEYHGTVIMHTCDNPRCCNPRHLIAGTQKDNVRDMIEKKRDALLKFKTKDFYDGNSA